ncbi:WD repeat-containing protein 3 [Lamellibrachia satsuma]|nr:WD repeat-containing protein 3 [Lamellibrachia satsuma]
MELRVWNIGYNQQETEGMTPAKRQRLDSGSEDSGSGEDSEQEEHDNSNLLSCTLHGSLRRRGRGRVVGMNLDPSGHIVGCFGLDSHLELFRLEAAEDVEKRIRKKRRKALKRARDAGDEETGVSVVQTLEDEITRLATIKMAAKIHSFDMCRHGDDNVVKVLCLLANNSLQLCEVNPQQTKPEATSMCQLSLPGHRTDVRTLSFSSDNTAILSASGETVKVWNRSSLNCIRTMSCDYALTSLFAPGDRHVIIGTKGGKLQIFDVAAGTLLETIDAHQGAVWSVSLSPDKRGIVSGSADHDVKFWDFELITDEEYSATRKRLTLVHTRTLKMAEDVLCVKFSPDHKLLAVALLDSTVKVFYADTLKFFLSLYGHKLPVLSLDISTDGTLLASGSGDRNVKLWGLDFGDCHKSIFAHDDSVMCVQFVPKTHMFFTCGRDGKIKQWDADNYERVLTLEAHKAEVWSLAVSPSGNFVVSSSHDKSLRLWEKTEEPLVLDDEKEMEREKQYEDAIGDGDQPVIAGETDTETGVAGKKTVATVKAAERIMEAIELYKEESAKLAQHDAECKASGKQLPSPPVHPMLQAHRVTSPTNYVLEVIKRVKSSELEEALLVLPFPYVTDLLRLLHDFIDSGWEVELVCRCILFLLRIHQGQITSNQVLLSVVDKLRSSTTSRVNDLRDMVGFNMAALNFVKQQLEEKEQVQFFADATQRFKEKKKKAKKRALLTLKS